MMVTVASVALLLVGVLNPMLLTATLGVAGAIVVYALRVAFLPPSRRFSILPISAGFLAGGCVGFVLLDSAYQAAREVRGRAAIAVEIALPSTLLALGLYQRFLNGSAT